MRHKMEKQTNHFSLPAWLRIVLIGRRPKFTLIRVTALVFVTFAVFPFVLLPIRVRGPSMSPTYEEGRINVVNRLAYLWHEPQRGDVVAIRFSGVSVNPIFQHKKSAVLMKRIVGLPGETVEFDHGQLFINGKPLHEPYVKYPCDWNLPPVKLSLERYYVVGDNRSMPAEAHTKGEPERERIVGKVLL